MKMDILFIDPPWIVENRNNIWKYVGSCLPSLGIAYIASYLEKYGFSCKIIDCSAERITVHNLKERCNFSAPRFIGITATTPLVTNGLMIARAAKTFFPETKIIFGGVHPTVLPEDVLANEFVDYVVRGEGEETTRELLSGHDPKGILGLSYKFGGKMYHNQERPLIKDLNSIPPPAYHLLPIKKYHPAVGSYKRLPAMSIFATRGCPGRCTFCYRIYGNRVRCRSAKLIIEEIEILQKEFGIREVCFYDDTLTLFKEELMRLCQEIISRKMDLTWSCFTRVDFVAEDLLKLMKASGCHLILYGIESGDEQMLKNINKKIDLKQAKRAVSLARKCGIDTRASYMFGNPGETEDTVKKTIKFALQLDTDEAQFNIATPYPGTEFFDWAKKNNYLSHTDWSNYHVSEDIVDLPTISRTLLKKYYKSSHRQYYLRPKIVLRRLLKINSLSQLRQELDGLKAVLTVSS